MLGTVEGHAHVTAFEFLGGDWHCGRPWSPFGVAYALPASCAADEQGTNGAFESLIDYGGATRPSDMHGWPTFVDWPSPTALAEEGDYYTGIERAWKAGLRLMVTDLVDNEALCSLMTTTPQPLQRHGRGEDPEQGPVRAAGLHRRPVRRAGQGLVPDRHRPVPGPQGDQRGQARGDRGHRGLAHLRLRRGQQRPAVRRAQIDAGLKEVHDLGVRTFFPIHEFDNAFGGTKMIAGERDGRQRRQPRRDRELLDVAPCPAKDQDATQINVPATGRWPRCSTARSPRCSRQTAAGLRRRPAVQRPRHDRPRHVPHQPDDQGALHHPARPHGQRRRPRRRWPSPPPTTTPGSSRPTAAPRRSSSAASTPSAASSARPPSPPGVRGHMEGRQGPGRTQVPLRLRLGLGHERPGRPARAGGRHPDHLPVQVLRRQGDLHPGAVGRPDVRPQHRRPRQLRHVRRLAARAPARRRQADDGRHVPGRRGLPRDLGARRRRVRHELPARSGALQRVRSGPGAAPRGHRPGRAVPWRSAGLAARALLPLLRERRVRSRRAGGQRVQRRGQGGADRDHGRGREGRRHRPRCEDRASEARGDPAGLRPVGGTQARPWRALCLRRRGGRVRYVAVAGAGELRKVSGLRADLRAAGL